MFVFDMVIWYQVKKASEVKEKAESYFSAFIQHNSSSVTLRAVDSLIAVDTLQSSFRSMFSIVRTGTPLKRERAGTDKLLSRRIFLRFMGLSPLHYCDDDISDEERKDYKIQSAEIAKVNHFDCNG